LGCGKIKLEFRTFVAAISDGASYALDQYRTLIMVEIAFRIR